jgi:hypothetical protein
MNSSLPVLAGTVSTVVFACSALPMLHKAAVTRDLGSYSLGNISLANAGNLVHSLYVFHLPAGPIWVLHGFYLVSSALMLFWYVRFAGVRLPRPARAVAASVSRREETGALGRGGGRIGGPAHRGSRRGRAHSG